MNELNTLLTGFFVREDIDVHHRLKFITAVLAAGLMLSVSAASAQTDSVPAYKRGKKPVYNDRINIVPKVTGGILIGKAGEPFPAAQDRAFYGFGASADFWLGGHFSLSPGAEVVWKNMGAFHINSVKTTSYSLGLLYRYQPYSTKSVYLRPEIGMITGTIPDYHLSATPDAQIYLRFGIGIYCSNASHTVSHLELYYKNAFTKAYFEDLYSSEKREFNVAGIGLEAGVGIPL